MKRIYKQGLLQLLYDNRVLLVISFLIMTFISIQDRMIYESINISIFDFVLLMYADHYNTMYFIYPIVFFIIAKDIRELSDIEILRYSNIFEFCAQKIIKFSIFILVYTFIIYAIRFIVGMGSFPFIYTIKPIEFDGINEVKYIFNLYAQYFSNGLVAVLSCILYLSLGFVFLYALLSYINQKFSYNMMVGLGIVIYLMSYIGFKSNSSSLSLVLFNNYLLIHQALFNNSLYVFALIIIIEISTISFSFFKSFQLKRGNRDESYRD